MKKWIATLLLAGLSGAWAQNPTTTTGQTTPGTQTTGTQTTGTQTQPQQQKQISDPAEYNALKTALDLPDPNGRINSLESFLQQYPNSVGKEAALMAIMQSAEQIQNGPKAVDAATRLLQINPNNVPACAVKVLADRAANNPQALMEAGQLSTHCLEALNTMPKGDNVSDADFQKQKDQLAAVFHAAAGMAALQNKDFATAQQQLQAAVQVNPNDLTNVYWLGYAYLNAPQMNPLGLWYIARAVNIAESNPQTAASAAQIQKYGMNKYVKYHGGDDGWQELLASTKTSEAPPANFTVAPAPTPAEQAAKLVATKNVNQMSFDEIQLVLTSGNQQAAQTVWNALQGKPQQFQARLISADRTHITAAATADDIEKNAADVDLTMAAPIPPAMVPKVSPDPNALISLEGTPTSYDVNPYMIHMKDGKLVKMGGKSTAPKGKTTGKKKKK